MAEFVIRARTHADAYPLDVVFINEIIIRTEIDFSYLLVTGS